MDTIPLPLAPLNTPLRDVLQAMRSHGRSAVVGVGRGESPDFFLFLAPDVVLEQAHGGTVLDSVSRRWRLHVPPVVEDALPHGIRGIDAEEQVHFLFDKTHASYALGAILRPNRALVITRSERLAAQLGSAPADCYCDGPGQHDATPPAGAACPLGDGTIVCVV